VSGGWKEESENDSQFVSERNKWDMFMLLVLRIDYWFNFIVPKFWMSDTSTFLLIVTKKFEFMFYKNIILLKSYLLLGSQLYIY